MRGGKREGAGRKAENRQYFKVRLSKDEYRIFSVAGGSKFLQQIIKQIQERTMSIKINTTKFTEAERQAFYNAFVAAGGPDDADENPNPWGAPWAWEPVITVLGTTIEEWAVDWYRQNREEIEGLAKAEDAEDGDYTDGNIEVDDAYSNDGHVSATVGLLRPVGTLNAGDKVQFEFTYSHDHSDVSVNVIDMNIDGCDPDEIDALESDILWDVRTWLAEHPNGYEPRDIADMREAGPFTVGELDDIERNPSQEWTYTATIELARPFNNVQAGEKIAISFSCPSPFRVDVDIEDDRFLYMPSDEVEVLSDEIAEIVKAWRQENPNG